LNNTIREKGVSTEPPPSENFSYEITQWKIFDAYMKDTQEVDAKATEKKGAKKPDQDNSQDLGQETSLYSSSFKRCLKIMERMVVQNDQKEQYHDYKYYWNTGETMDTQKNEGH